MKSLLLESNYPTNSKIPHLSSCLRGFLVALLCMGSCSLTAKGDGLERVKYNNPGLVVDLSVGLWAFPFAVDFNRDGNLDLLVDSVDAASTGVYIFENPTGKSSFPVFKPGRWLSKGRSNVQVSIFDGTAHLLAPGVEYLDFMNVGLANPTKIRASGKIHPNPIRMERWSYVDYDGDGKMDIIIGLDDWTEYGWANAYDGNGNWVNGPLHGFVYLLRNDGTNEAPVYAPAVKVMAGDAPVDTYGSPSPNFADFRKNGKLDLICGEFLDGFTFYENIGTRTAPKYAPGRRLKTPEGKPLVMDLQLIMPTAIDWNKDGYTDLVVGDEDGRVALIENTGQVDKDGTPVFRAPHYFQQEADDVDLGALNTSVGFDWNGDGSMDILSGNSAGEIVFLENLSAPGVEKPKWAAPKLLNADGKPIRIMAGRNGSLQGPAEAKWGYTALTVADWDGDGLPDLIVNSIWGKVVWYRNIGTRTQPKLSAAQPIEVEWEGEQPSMAWGWLKPEGKALLVPWRTTPVAVDWDGDGLVDLVTVDHEQYVALYQRRKLPDGRLVLNPPKRCLVNEKHEPLRFNGIPPKGYIGCKKFAVTDWDGDGKLDLLVSGNPVAWWRQTEALDGQFIFKCMGTLGDHSLGSHDPAPGTVDWNGDGIPDLIVGSEGGHIYYLRNPRTAQH